jgi:hypothetical protein
MQEFKRSTPDAAIGSRKRTHAVVVEQPKMDDHRPLRDKTDTDVRIKKESDELGTNSAQAIQIDSDGDECPARLNRKGQSAKVELRHSAVTAAQPGNDNEDDIENDYEDQNNNENSDYEETQPSHEKPQMFEQLPIVLAVPASNNAQTIESIDSLPETVRLELEGRHEATWTKTKSRVPIYRRLSTSPATYMDIPFCIRDQLSRRSKRGKAVPDQAYDHGGRYRVAADDKCINSSVPCAHLIVHGGEPAICFVPLPEVARNGRTWQELGFWVRD